MSYTVTKKTVESLDIDNKEEILRQIEEVAEETWLSKREAEVSVMMKHGEYESLKQLAHDLSISENTIYQHVYSINQKLGKARRTIRHAEKS